MNCPYCKEEMIKGFVYGDRYALKWLPETKNLLMGIWAKDGLTVSKRGKYGGRTRVEALMCQSCHKLMIDMNNEA
jgi:hypothetical protein